ncbi:MAG: transporter substrate-binding protein [Paenibacillus sp.]|jgi:tripartite-type tricarboxylate transporter receptor subunit TctC|nr:transporter substrate-binding protein [Paenibacillus sp.]
MKNMFTIRRGMVLMIALLMAFVTACSSKGASAGGQAPNTPASTNSGQSSKDTAYKFTKPIQMIVPVPPGGSSDLVARAIAKTSEKYFGQPMVVINRDGGAGAVGTTEVVKSKPDSFTFGYLPVGSINVLPQYGGLSYKTSDLEPIAFVSNEPSVLVVKKGKFKDLADFVAQAKAKPGSLKYGVSAVGGTVHIVMASFLHEAKIDVKLVGFKGSGEVKTAILGGHIDSGIMSPSDAKSMVESGDLQLLAVAEPNRYKVIPDVPTFTEQGYPVQLGVWKAIMGPRGISEDAKKAVVEGFKKTLTDPELQSTLAKNDVYIEYKDPVELQKLIDEESKKYEKILKDTGVAEFVKKQNK